MKDSSSDLLKISPGDNVWVAVRNLAAGTELVIEGNEVTLDRQIGLGHKLAACSINMGEKIIKCDAPIGSATEDIAVGDHVHLHNLKSDYIPTRAGGAAS